MAGRVRILGVHPVEADEPVHLIELVVEGNVQDFDIGEVTQEVAGEPRDNWQVPYDERLLEETDGKVRYAFFFHYLDLDQPLVTPIGDARLPKPTDVPQHLEGIEYDAP